MVGDLYFSGRKTEEIERWRVVLLLSLIMSDSHLRDLERRFKETGAVEDEALHLGGRVRAGELSQERLQLAAFLGHAAARAVLVDGEHDNLVEMSTLGALFTWTEEIADRVGKEALLRMSIALARMSLSLSHELGLEALRSQLQREIERAEESIFRSTVVFQSNNAEEDDRLHLAFSSVLEEIIHCACSAIGGRGYPESTFVAYPIPALKQLIDDPNRAADRTRSFLSAVFEDRDRVMSDVVRPIQRQIALELIPWALGTTDPVLGRVEERRAQVRDVLEAE